MIAMVISVRPEEGSCQPRQVSASDPYRDDLPRLRLIP